MELNIYPKLYLQKGREKSDSRFHPWIFSGAISSKTTNIKQGDLVSVFSADEEFIGIGTFSPSTIAVKILSRIDVLINKDFWLVKLRDARKLREELDINSNAYRLVHGEGDYLPGLIIDKYDRVFVIQAHDEGIFKQIENIKNALVDLYGKDISIYNKSKKSIPFLNNVEDSYIYGEELEQVIIEENGLKFYVDIVSGQKTGFYIDQRDNRKLINKFSKGKKVLNTFCYSGAFSVYALSAGASSCHSVDSSEIAITKTKENIELNFKNSNHTEEKIEVFKFFERNTEKFELIIVDPPSFAKHPRAKKQALHAYTKTNRMAIEALEEKGIIFTFSCSQAVSEEEFQRSIFNAVLSTNRKCQIIAKLGQPSDHPLDIYHQEGKYLKGFLLKFD
jgi:23S rRNA (cytosine1962-C5)-methyltransferase